jgi:outer membrane protein assembly factor BamD
MRMRWVSFIFFCFVAASLAVGCAHEKEVIKPAEELFKEASALAKKGKVEKAAEAFMQVRTYYPAHDLARKSVLATGDLYFDQELYEEALKNYEEFRLLYPTDVEAGYCLYRIGLCHYEQMSTFDREQSETSKAIQTFQTFLKTYSGSPYVTDATAKLKEAKTRLATHYLSIGKFYLKKHNSKAACNRFQLVKRQYPDIDLGEDIDSLISRACTTGN